ncbi:MAG TPA: acetyl-CoA carboxylase biotin carboxyl carrier protein subunit [Phycisphaerae bacterium]|nr:acetyl-CoA carboxylase biotin carboxyl carrier protein subunit [Phycisphaerae bacterium]
MDGRIHSFELVDRSAQRSGAASAQGNLAGDTVIAPMPGTILKIHVAAGDDISTHAPLIVMESMKMEMTLAAPRDGRVRAVSCEAGQLVEMGKLLLTLEPREHA